VFFLSQGTWNLTALLIVSVINYVGVVLLGAAKSQDLEDNELISVAHRLTTLEMKELNERQRAEHASRMYEQQKTLFRQLEDRNFELEHKFAEVGAASFLHFLLCFRN